MCHLERSRNPRSIERSDNVRGLAAKAARILRLISDRFLTLVTIILKEVRLNRSKIPLAFISRFFTRNSRKKVRLRFAPLRMTRRGEIWLNRLLRTTKGRPYRVWWKSKLAVGVKSCQIVCFRVVGAPTPTEYGGRQTSRWVRAYQGFSSGEAVERTRD